ncbi:MAG: hypothetical protein RR662_05030 [Clostridia bacterium]
MKAVYFGAYTNPYKAASRRAYRDMNRTIRFGNLEVLVRENIRNTIDELLESEIVSIMEEKQSQKEYDDWHQTLSIKMIDVYQKHGVHFTYGQAQKWINMMMKYLYVLCPNNVEKNFCNLHIPIDNYIFSIAQKELNIKYPANPWSRWESYEEYIDYQKLIRTNLQDIAPLRWEFVFWLKEARNL